MNHQVIVWISTDIHIGKDPVKHMEQLSEKQVDILISKNQVLQILYLKHHT